MASDWTDWADGSDLADMSRSTDPLNRAGIDPDDVRANPELREMVMKSAGSPYGLSLLRSTGPVTPAPSMQPPVTSAARTNGVGATSTAPRTTAPAPVATPSPQPSSDLDALGREALEKGLALGNFASKNAEALANTDPDADPTVQALKAQESKDATPTPYLDPATGKVLPSAEQYKPSGWDKFGRGLKSAALGLFEGGPFGAAIGAIEPGMVHGGTAYDAPNKAYDVTEAAREQRLASEQAQLADAGARFKAMTDARKAASTAAGTAATAFGDVDKGVTAMQPKPGGKTGEPQQMMVNGKPALVTWDPAKGYLDAAPGPTFGQPVQGTVAPIAPEPKAATDAFHEWLDNPSGYEKFAKTMAALKSEKGAYGSFGPAFLAYHMLNTAYNENPALLPALAPLLAKMMSSAGAGGDGAGPGNFEDLLKTIAAVPAGQPRGPGGAPIGLRQPGAPTGATRSRGQFAQSVLPSVDEAIKQIGQLGKDVGPLSGRWLDFYQGKIGADNPDYAGLSTSLHNIATAWMRLHANSDSARQEFEHALRSAQSPADLVAALNSIESQAGDYVKEGQGRPDTLGDHNGAAGGAGGGEGFDWGKHAMPVQGNK